MISFFDRLKHYGGFIGEWFGKTTYEELDGNEYMIRTFADSSMWIYIAALIVTIVIAYLLGSINTALLVSKIKYKDDIRKYGSKNAGMTNMLRTYGKGAAAATLLGDALKAVVSVMLGMLLCGEIGGYICGLACALGHAFPVYFKFKGGKSVVVSAATLLCLEPLVFIVMLLFFVIIVAFTRYISLGSIMCMLIYPFVLNRFYVWVNPVMPYEPMSVIILSLLLSALVIFLHRENIKRLWNGEERKVSFKSKKS